MNALTYDEKNKLYNEHKGIIYYMANRYRHLDNDFDELVGWCNYGYARAIYEYETKESVELVGTAFDEIRYTIYSAYYRRSSKGKTETSLYSQSDDGTELIEFIDEEVFAFEERDIVSMIKEALFEETNIDRKIVMDSIIKEKSVDEIVVDTGLPRLRIKRSIRKGEILLKTYLSNNDLISDYLLYGKKQSRKKHEYQRLAKAHLSKIKYIRFHYQHLNVQDIAKVLQVDPYPIVILFEYPTTNYLRATPDETVEDVVLEYCKHHYPERLASEVKVYEMV